MHCTRGVLRLCVVLLCEGGMLVFRGQIAHSAQPTPQLIRQYNVCPVSLVHGALRLSAGLSVRSMEYMERPKILVVEDEEILRRLILEGDEVLGDAQASPDDDKDCGNRRGALQHL